jgi:predicted NAD/FAD-binding protein
MLQFPIATLIRFCHNHGLIQVTDRPQWHTVRGGSRQYVDKLVRGLRDARSGAAVRAVRRLPAGPGPGGVIVATDHGSERFDEVVLACHSDQSLALLADPSAAEHEVLAAVRYQANHAVLHTDAAVLPRRRLAWAAWNYARAKNTENEQAGVCLHYLINRLQPLPWSDPVIVSLNPITEPRADCVIGDFAVDHPVFDQAAIAAQERLPSIQGLNSTWFCGAWTRYGFHEDGVRSANAVLRGLRAQLLAAKPSHAQSSPPYQPGAVAL